jgi:hypothetical protein
LKRKKQSPASAVIAASLELAREHAAIIAASTTMPEQSTKTAVTK